MTYPITPKEFLIQHLTEGRSYQDVADEYGIRREVLTEWWNNETATRERIKRANQLFNARTGKDEFTAFDEMKKRRFFEWFDSQPRACGYCGIEESKLEILFDLDNPILETSRHRGRKLELERRNTENNDYTPSNCLMACYLCNNHKSDLISEEDHRKYFAPVIRKYLDDQFDKRHGH